MNNSKQICIICIDHHFDVLDNILFLLAKAPVKIHLFTSHKILTLIRASKDIVASTILCQNSNLQKKVLEQKSLLLTSSQILIITVYRNFKFYYQLSKQFSVSIIIHNSHFAFQDGRYSCGSGSMKDKLIRMYRNTMMGQNRYKKRLLGHVQMIYFLSSHTLEYAKSNYPAYKQKMSLLPYRYSIPIRKIQNGSFCIVIPGGANITNRNYQPFFQWINNYVPSRKVEVVFLGISTDSEVKSIKKSIRHVKSDLVTIRFFDQYLDQNDYHQWLLKASILLAPLNWEATYLGYCEMYGYSKISGSVADCIKAQVPLLIPAFYPFRGRIEKSHSSLRRSSEL